VGSPEPCLLRVAEADHVSAMARRLRPTRPSKERIPGSPPSAAPCPVACSQSFRTRGSAALVPSCRIGVMSIEAIEIVNGDFEGKEEAMAALRKPKGLGQ